MKYPRIARLKTYEAFRNHLSELGIDLPSDSEVSAGDAAPLAQPMDVDGRRVGNRFCILPMEGWDAAADGSPSELTRRRWRHFGLSGAKLIWGGEAVAVRHDGRANPNQLVIREENLSAIASLREELVGAHEEAFGASDDLLIGLQLTHSGRYACPNVKGRGEPRPAHRNAVLDRRMGITDDSLVFSDEQLAALVEDFVAAAVRAEKAGFDFIDIKHCHGYLGHELLSGIDRPGRYGGSFENRTRFLREVVEGVRAATSHVMLAVRASIFDFVPFAPGPDQRGMPEADGDPRLAFGGDGSGCGVDLKEPSRFLELLEQLRIRLVCTTAGSPYYNPHIQRPAYFPPSDGYAPPEDPLVGVARQIEATAKLKHEHPQLRLVGSGYSYLQEWLPSVAQAVVRRGLADAVGLGRMVLSYPELPADVLASGTMAKRKKICRTFSDCTTAPRNGLVSGCYPLDPFYKERPERRQLQQVKKTP